MTQFLKGKALCLGDFDEKIIEKCLGYKLEKWRCNPTH
jgi:hypothetical protein